MNWTNRMTRHGSEKSLHSLHSLHGQSNGSTSPRLPIGGNLPTKTGSAPSTPSTPSPVESRIPRPSPTALRRSASLRVRGERASNFRVNALVSPTSQHPNRHLLQQQQNQHHEYFPVITENGSESSRDCYSSLSLTPARPQRLRSVSRSSAAYEGDSDVESVKSYGSVCSTASACDHATFALNGTTWSGRSRRYVVHCSNHADNEEYLTPTQRAARQVRKFQTLLHETRKEIDEKDREILRLTKEVVELRLYKASLSSPEEKTDSSDAPTVREKSDPHTPQSPSKDIPDKCYPSCEEPASPRTPEKRIPEPPSSLVDSGHFDDGSVHSKDSASLTGAGAVAASSTAVTPGDNEEGVTLPVVPVSPVIEVTVPEVERRKLVDHYETRIEEMHRRHVDEVQTMKEGHNDKVESLLNQLSELNTRYCEARPSLEAAETRTREMEKELEEIRTELNEKTVLLNEQEERNKQMYLKMYAKGQEAARFEQADQIIVEQASSSTKVTVADLLQQLTITQAELENIKDTSYTPEPHITATCSQHLLSAQEAVSLWVLGTRKAMYRRIVNSRNQGSLDPEITLQFLKSAVYYFLTDKENIHGHLNAIESILGFSESEKNNIDRIYRTAKK